MKKNKKSIETGTLVLYILVCAVALVLVGVTFKATQLATKDVKKRACEWDITKSAFFKNAPDIANLFTRGHKLTSLNNCRRDKLGNLIIKYNDVVENGIINQNKAAKIIADEMVECWKMVGEGKIDPFSNWVKKGESYCMICSTIKFDERLTQLYNKGVNRDSKGGYTTSEENLKKYTIQPIGKYLMEKEVKKGMTYWKFLYHSSIDYSKNKPSDDLSLIVLESTILIQMYKLESKGWVVTGVVVGGVLTAAGLILAIPSVGTSLGLSALGAGILAAGGIAIGVSGIAAVVHASFEAYKDCEECNAIGGIQLIPPKQEFNIKINAKLGEEEKSIPLCSIIVN